MNNSKQATMSDWVKKFGIEVIEHWREKNEIPEDSHIFKFNKGNLLNKIKDEEDLFHFTEYIEGDFTDKRASYYSVEYAKYEKIQKGSIEIAEDVNDVNPEILDESIDSYIIENMNDIAEKLVEIESRLKIDVSSISKSITNVEKIMTTLQKNKRSKGAEYNQLVEVKAQLEDIKKYVLHDNHLEVAKKEFFFKKLKNKKFEFDIKQILVLSVFIIGLVLVVIYK